MKVLVSDFDGTLFCNIDELKINKQAVKKFRKQGNLFIIATGRNLTSIKKEIEHLNITFDYLICNDGALIFNNTFKLLDRTDIPLSCNEKILQVIEKINNQYIWYLDDGINYKKDITSLANKIIIKIEDRLQAKELLNIIKKEVPELDGYISNNWINLIDKSVNKSTGILKLKELLNLDLKDIYTIGDNINDYKMLEAYNGYRMNNTKNLDIISLNIPNIKSVAGLIEELMKKE